MELLTCRGSFGPSELELNKNRRAFLWSSVQSCWSQKMNLLTIYDIQILSITFVESLQNHCRRHFHSCLYLHKNDGFLTWNPRVRDFEGCSSFITTLNSRLILKIVRHLLKSSEKLRRWGFAYGDPVSSATWEWMQRFLAQGPDRPGPAFSTGHKVTHMKTFHGLENVPWCGFILLQTQSTRWQTEDRTYGPFTLSCSFSSSEGTLTIFPSEHCCFRADLFPWNPDSGSKVTAHNCPTIPLPK